MAGSQKHKEHEKNGAHLESVKVCPKLKEELEDGEPGVMAELEPEPEPEHGALAEPEPEHGVLAEPEPEPEPEHGVLDAPEPEHGALAEL